mmetsp:Transcript_16073/g.34752  ORF Transcript_16073/g.34752 Transcript_16073/m.34752 type:complete len:257 (+) Transcript_16073:137-907(+)
MGSVFTSLQCCQEDKSARLQQTHGETMEEEEPNIRFVDEEEVAKSVPRCRDLFCKGDESFISFKVYVHKGENESLGLNLDTRDPEVLSVDWVGPGLLARWNLTQPRDAVQRGDQIIEVNGVKGDSKSLVQECQQTGSLCFVVRRRVQASRSLAVACCGKSDPMEFFAVVDKGGGRTLGINVDRKHRSSLLVDGIETGLIQEWNQSHPTEEIKVGDLIVEVNGVVGDVSALMEECKRDTMLRLRLQRQAIMSCDCTE